MITSLFGRNRNTPNQSNINQYADKDGKVNLGTWGNDSSQKSTPKAESTTPKTNNSNDNSRDNSNDNKRIALPGRSPTREDRQQAINRKTRQMAVKGGLDSIFGSGRSKQGTIGQVSPIFQSQKKQLQAEIDRENKALDTVAAAEAELEAAQVTQEGRLAVQAAERAAERIERFADILNDDKAATEALRETGLDRQEMQRIFDRVQNGLDITDTERAQYEAFYKYGRAHMAARAGQARIEASKDLLEHQRVLAEAFKLHGAGLSKAMNQQQINNLVASLEQMSRAEARVLGENAAALGKAMGMQAAQSIGAKMEFFVGAYLKAQEIYHSPTATASEKQAATLKAAAIRDTLGVGLTKQFFQDLMNRANL